MNALQIDVAEPEIDGIDGCSLGHMTVSSDAGTATSAAKMPDQAMVVLLAVPLLLDQLQTFLQPGREGSLRFNGMGGSFAILFTRKAGDRLQIRSSGVALGTHPMRDVVEAVWKGVHALWKTYTGGYEHPSILARRASAYSTMISSRFSSPGVFHTARPTLAIRQLR